MKKGLFVIGLVGNDTKRVKGYDVTKEVGAPVDLFVYKCRNRWVLTDKKTGFSFGSRYTRKEAINFGKSIEKDFWQSVKRMHKRDNTKEIIENVEKTYSGVFLDENVKAWYTLNFPDDNEGDLIDNEMTFSKFFHYLSNGFTLKSIIGTDDSTVRERLFKALADSMDWATYEDIYNIWLESADHDKEAA